MSKFSNLYDIDGNIINKSPQHTFTLEETEQLVDDLTKKVQENPDNEVYKVYLNNAQKWLMHLYDNMSREDLMKRMSIIQDSIKDAKNEATSAEQDMLDKVNKAVEELKKEYENENTEPDTAPTEPETGGEPELVEPVEQIVENNDALTQEDMLVERDSAPIEMEEVIDA
jgi:AAA+ ATPase superfamily predicted ATPase